MTDWISTDGTVTILGGDCRQRLADLEAGTIACCVTSPPYWGLRDYGTGAEQLGLEARPDCLGWATGSPCGECYVCHMVDVFRAVRRVLRDDGTLWLNLGDSYAGSWGNYGGGLQGAGKQRLLKHGSLPTPAWEGREGYRPPASYHQEGLKPKDLCGIPWRVALALQADGWYLRQDIIWAKPNPMPESVGDRCTKSHEYLFLLAKSKRYYYDAEAIREEWTSGREDMRVKGVRTGLAYLQEQSVASNSVKTKRPDCWKSGKGTHGTIHDQGREAGAQAEIDASKGRNKRSVWTIPTAPYKGAHFATFPPALVRPCILAGSRPGETVLDPFSGSGTTLQVARLLGRNAVGVELSAEYRELGKVRSVSTLEGTDDTDRPLLKLLGDES